VDRTFKKLLEGYNAFREKYAHGDESIMQYLSQHGQQPNAMVIACCDSRVDPAVILQCEPGDLFVARNVANIVPRYSTEVRYQGTSAALEFGLCFLGVQHLILLGHSQCGGIEVLLNHKALPETDFVQNWVSLIKAPFETEKNLDEFAKQALRQSYKNCLTFPWIKEKIEQQQLTIHLWFFDIKTGQIFTYSEQKKTYVPLDDTFGLCHQQ